MKAVDKSTANQSSSGERRAPYYLPAGNGDLTVADLVGRCLLTGGETE